MPAPSNHLRHVDRHFDIRRLQWRALEDVVGTRRDHEYQVAIDAEYDPIARLRGVDADCDLAGLIDCNILEQANRWRGSPQPDSLSRQSMVKIIMAGWVRAAGAPQAIHGRITWRHDKSMRPRTGIFQERQHRIIVIGIDRLSDFRK